MSRPQLLYERMMFLAWVQNVCGVLLCSVEAGLGLVDIEQINFWFGVRRTRRQNASP